MPVNVQNITMTGSDVACTIPDKTLCVLVHAKTSDTTVKFGATTESPWTVRAGGKDAFEDMDLANTVLYLNGTASDVVEVLSVYAY